MKKIGLLGGSFDPVHNAHLRLSRHLLDHRISDEVWLMPCGNHAFKKDASSVEHRKNMVDLAINGLCGLYLCDIELRSSTRSYSLETIKRLRAEYPGHDFSLIIGTDILKEISLWHRYKELLQETDFILFQRLNYQNIPIPGMRVKHFISENADAVSSTDIRERVRAGQSISDLVPQVIEDYIRRYNLYRGSKT